jgi:hypothetical protein
VKVREEVVELPLPRDESRSPGRHLSSILRDLAFKTGVLDPKYNNPVEDGDTTLIQLGMAWEDYLAAHHFGNIQYHPGELRLDGIAMSPDGIEDVGGEWVLWELKLSKKSSRDFRDKLRLSHKSALLYLWQVKAYRHALNQLFPAHRSNSIKLDITFINNGYDRSPDAPNTEHKLFTLEATDAELRENWQMVLSHAASMEESQ